MTNRTSYHKKQKFRSQITDDESCLIPPFINCVTLSHLSNLSFPYLQNVANNGTNLTVIIGMNICKALEIMHDILSNQLVFALFVRTITHIVDIG